MKERIRELAEKAGMTEDKFGMYFAKYSHDQDGVDLQKFAKLIRDGIFGINLVRNKLDIFTFRELIRKLILQILIFKEEISFNLLEKKNIINVKIPIIYQIPPSIQIHNLAPFKFNKK